MTSILALNVSAPPEARAKELLGWLWHEGEDDDVWVLTETSASPGSRLLAKVCRAAGFSVHVSDYAAGGGLGVIVVVRTPSWAVQVEEVEGLSVLPGRVLPLRLSREEGGGQDELSLVAVYGAASDPVRYSSREQRQRKREWIEGWGQWLPVWRSDVARHGASAVVVGDLNLVDPLHDDELRYVLPEETALLSALEQEHGLVDAYRRCHPGSREVSWVDHSGVGCRYDHAFVAADLAPAIRSCDLLHEPREAGLTDHSALRLVLGP